MASEVKFSADTLSQEQAFSRFVVFPTKLPFYQGASFHFKLPILVPPRSIPNWQKKEF
jgi:hypothetical protein